MTIEEDLQKEWRTLIINKLNSLDDDLKKMGEKLDKITVSAYQIDSVKAEVKLVKEELKDFKLKVEKNRVVRSEFDMVKKIVYGAIGLIVLGVFGALLKLVVH